MKPRDIFLAIAMLCLLSGLTNSADFTNKQDDRATFWIYKGWHSNTIWRATFGVWINEKEVARLDRGIYMIAKLAPGKYDFRTKNKKAGGVTLDVKAGETHYIRMDTDTSLMVIHPRLSIVAPEQARFDLKEMKPIEKRDVRDTSIIVTDYTHTQAVK